MPIFDAKSRSWSAYVAGIGASGMLMASAFVMFVILVGVVTFKNWPHPGNLLGLGGGGDVTLGTTAKQPPRAQAQAQPATLNLVKLLAPRTGASRHGTHAGGPGGGLNQGQNQVSPGARRGLRGTGGGEPQVAGPPSSSQPRNAVSQVLSGAGDTVESDTESLGDSLGGSSSPGLGGVIGGLGRTLNSDLQSLAGS